MPWGLFFGLGSAGAADSTSAAAVTVAAASAAAAAAGVSLATLETLTPLAPVARSPPYDSSAPPPYPIAAIDAASPTLAKPAQPQPDHPSVYSTVAAAAARLRRLASPRPPSPRWPHRRPPARTSFSRGGTCADDGDGPLCTEFDLQGRWVSSRKKGRAFIVSGGVATYERNGRRYPVVQSRACGILIDGCTVTATRRDAERISEIRWSDGDVWTRDDAASGCGQLAPTPTTSPTASAGRTSSYTDNTAALMIFDGLELRSCDLGHSPSVRSFSASSTAFSTRASTPAGSTVSASTQSTARRRGHLLAHCRYDSALSLSLSALAKLCESDVTQQLCSHSSPSGRALLQGRWRSSRKKGSCVTVAGAEAVYERSGKRYRVDDDGADGRVRLDGCSIVSVSADGTVVHWTDGDVWTRADLSGSYTPVTLPERRSSAHSSPSATAE